MKGLKSIININQNINFNDHQKSYKPYYRKQFFFFFFFSEISKPINQKSSHAIMKITRETSIDHAEDRVTVTEIEYRNA